MAFACAIFPCLMRIMPVRVSLNTAKFIALRDGLPDYLRDPVNFLYLSGWRLGEMQTFQWRDVDLVGRLIRLRTEHSKNKSTRILPLAGSCLMSSSRLEPIGALIASSCSTG
jgi:integrase